VFNTKTINVCHKSSPHNNNTNGVTTYKKQPCMHDRVKLIYIDDEYSGLIQGICGTVSGICPANEICKSVNRPEPIICVKWDNGIELGLIEGIDKYEIVSDVTTNSSIQAAQQIVNSH
jgi:hypothetical protein